MTSQQVDALLETLNDMTVADLRLRYREVFGEPTASVSKPHLIKRIAWRTQALALGGLSERAKRLAAELADDAELRLRAPTPQRGMRGTDAAVASAPTITRFVPTDPRLPRAGTVIRRRYKGAYLHVRVLAAGFEFNGQTYRSLTAVARAATGSHCNGMRFFGLAGAGTPGHTEVDE
ncbi:MAG: DUF2924 domain-containing protein [Phycisphaerales bacterium]|nr:DUF2924 domain-containing protein [Phycisphaerales bacterium]